jgi:hypothetical protein
MGLVVDNEDVGLFNRFDVDHTREAMLAR